MSVLVRGMEMPKNCRECNFCNELNFEGYLWFDFYCRAKDKSFDLDKNKDKPDWCPLIEIPPHGDLIDKEVLYNKTAEWEAQAMARIEELNRIPFDEMEREEYIGWRVWSAICQERSAFKHDVFDAPVVLKGEDDAEVH